MEEVADETEEATERRVTHSHCLSLVRRCSVMLDLAEGVRVDRVVWAGLLFGFETLSEMSVEVASVSSHFPCALTTPPVTL